MRTFIKSIIKFIPFCLTFYILMLIFYGLVSSHLPLRLNFSNKKGGYGYAYSRLEEVKNYSNIDILFIGSSHAYRGFDPRIFEKNGLKTFNLGTSAQTPLQTEILLNRYLEKLNPKMIIYDVYPKNVYS
jgi:hypothetical protein